MSKDTYDQAKAQAESIKEMVAALSVDYERLDELREQKAESRFSVNWSLIGCMPDGEPSFYADEEDARAALVEELRERQEQDEEAAEMARESMLELDQETAAEMKERARQYEEAADTVEDEEISSIIVNGWHFWIYEDAAGGLSEEEREELEELEEAAGDCEDEEDARQRIQEDALSVEIRSDWHMPGDEEGARPSDFRIVLCTGGPHVEIRGELDEHLEPSRAWLESCGWFESMVNHGGTLCSQETLLEYARCFYFGDGE